MERPAECGEGKVFYVGYGSELQMPSIVALIERDLSEPYSIFTYRYFINNWPNLCFMAMVGDQCVGTIVCKLDRHRETYRGYIAMLAVRKDYRSKGLGSSLVVMALNAMVKANADECVLETELTNSGALRLYEKLGFVRHKRLQKYYLNGVDAFRLKLWFN